MPRRRRHGAKQTPRKLTAWRSRSVTRRRRRRRRNFGFHRACMLPLLLLRAFNACRMLAASSPHSPLYLSLSSSSTSSSSEPTWSNTFLVVLPRHSCTSSVARDLSSHVGPVMSDAVYRLFSLPFSLVSLLQRCLHREVLCMTEVPTSTFLSHSLAPLLPLPPSSPSLVPLLLAQK